MAKIDWLPAYSVRGSLLACWQSGELSWPFRELLSFRYLSPDAQQHQPLSIHSKKMPFGIEDGHASRCLPGSVWHRALGWVQDIKVSEVGGQTLSSGCGVKIEAGGVRAGLCTVMPGRRRHTRSATNEPGRGWVWAGGFQRLPGVVDL